jgi:hypothetical protein
MQKKLIKPQNVQNYNFDIQPLFDRIKKLEEISGIYEMPDR